MLLSKYKVPNAISSAMNTNISLSEEHYVLHHFASIR